MKKRIGPALMIAAAYVLLAGGAAPLSSGQDRTDAESRRLAGLFERMGSDDKDSSCEALRLLSEENPAAVRKLLGSGERAFGFKYGFLGPLITFVEYCRAHAISYRPDAAWSEKLKRLGDEMPFRDRARLETEYAGRASLKDIPALEYWAVIYSYDFWRYSSSLSRILNICYSRFWTDILGSREELRFYLKKSALFADLGIVGLCRDYFRRFGHASKKTIEALKAVQDSDPDPQIRDQAAMILTHAGLGLKAAAPETRAGLPLEQFLARIDTIDPESVELVRLQGTDSEYRRVFGLILKETRPALLAKWIRLLEVNIAEAMAPFLMELIERRDVIDKGFANYHDREMRDHPVDIEITVSDRIVNMLEFLFDYAFPKPPEPKDDAGGFISGTASGNAFLRDKGRTAPQWLALWRADGADYRRWGEKLYARKLDNLKTRDAISVDDLIDLLHSRFLTPAARREVWSASTKVRPPEALAKLKIEEGMISPAEWKYLTKFKGAPDRLAAVIEKTNVTPDQYGALMAFLKDSCSRYSTEEKGRLFLELCHWEPLRQALRGETDEAFLKEIQAGLRMWVEQPLRGEDFFKEWADGLRFYVETCRLPLEEQLVRLETYSGPGAEDAAIQLLDMLDYSDLGAVLKHLARLPLPDFRKVRYIIEDFGICVEDWSEDKLEAARIDELAARCRSLSEKDLYAFYLDRLGVDYKKSDGSLDFEKIRRILKFDSLYGFMSSTTYDKHVLTLMRILELTFGTRLGHEMRFNHAIGNLVDCIHCRAKNWLVFLENKKLVPPAVDDAPAF